MPELNGLQFHDVQPYFPGNKSKPSQGKLFRDPKPTDEHRYPRGYTPERMNEVRQATEGSGELIHQRQVDMQGRPTASTLTGAALDSPYHAPHGKRLVNEAIARSNIPTEHLRDMQAIHIHTGIREPKARGYYQILESAVNIEPMKGDLGAKRGIQANTGNADKRVNRTQARPLYDATLVHEIGHHADMLHRFKGDPENMADSVNRPGGVGRAEGHADSYMLERFKNDPRNQRRTKFDPHTITYGASGGLAGYPQEVTDKAQGVVRDLAAGQVSKLKENMNRKAAASAQRKRVAKYKAQQKRRKG